MQTALIVLIATQVVTLALLFASLYYNYKFGLKILEYVDQVEDVLDIFDERYENISKVIELPLFYDSPQIRAVVEDIKECRDSVLKAANIIADVEIKVENKEEA